MRQFRHAGIIWKYTEPYYLLRDSGGEWVVGKWVPPGTERVELRGSIQPVSARLLAGEGGYYTETDRKLYTTSTHATGERIEYRGVQYTVVESPDRAYSDVNQYLLRKVVANAPV
ncbi:hypothetical protein KIH86_03640 [Paenibacillus sp. HN-1]|uniref:hypothetical protein n=1 Tax=Paenibacillus TaxID=44249 RepID=UPI001CA9689D|nr:MULTISPECIES: hypothetical protein [Paenibacillus]MBY9077275.1 hypothetical protein [Paenibacillus sp. CGMCC 1.18879]MBY9083322.1 hypothetical protein [Paenibacillus sinensis]